MQRQTRLASGPRDVCHVRGYAARAIDPGHPRHSAKADSERTVCAGVGPLRFYCACLLAGHVTVARTLRRHGAHMLAKVVSDCLDSLTAILIKNDPADLLCEVPACDEEQQLQEGESGSYFHSLTTQRRDPYPNHWPL